MSQDEVYRFLLDNPGIYYSSIEIAEHLKISYNCVNRALFKLKYWNDIKESHRQVSCITGGFRMQAVYKASEGYPCPPLT